MASIFSKIVTGDIPCHKVAESEKFLAFLDVMPLRKGHVLVIPKEEVDFIFDMSDDLLQEILVFAKPIAQRIQEVFPCKKVGVTVIGLEVPHAHIHLIPINSIADMDFSQEKLKLTTEELADIAAKLRIN
jgi:histidine triad (HIT) family protein